MKKSLEKVIKQSMTNEHVEPEEVEIYERILAESTTARDFAEALFDFGWDGEQIIEALLKIDEKG